MEKFLKAMTQGWRNPGIANEQGEREGGPRGDRCKGRAGSHGMHWLFLKGLSPGSDQKPWKVRYLVTFSCWKKFFEKTTTR